MRAVESEGLAVQTFADALVRRLPAEAGEGATLRLAPLAEALGLPEARLDAGLDYLAARRLLEVSRPEAGLTLAWHHARTRTVPVNAAALDRGRQRAHARLDDVVRYANALGCRRQHLLAYFGEQLPAPCGNCDNCLDPPATFDASEPAQLARSGGYRTGERCGVGRRTVALKAEDGPLMILGGESTCVLREGAMLEFVGVAPSAATVKVSLQALC